MLELGSRRGNEADFGGELASHSRLLTSSATFFHLSSNDPLTFDHARPGRRESGTGKSRREVLAWRRSWLFDASGARMVLGCCGLGQPHGAWEDREGRDIEFIHGHEQPPRVSDATKFGALLSMIASSVFERSFHCRFLVVGWALR